MKKLVILLIILLVIPPVIADWFYNSQHVTANIDIYSEAEVAPTRPSGYIQSATINMTFFPKETDTQELLEFETVPDADVDDETIKFTWKRPEDKIDFRVIVDVKTTNSRVQVREKINFPIEELPDDIEIYTKSSKTIDSGDEAIIRLASELVKGEDDLYAAVFKVADWTKNNIDYNLSTLTAEVSQKASWVLQNRQGVCDELTSLFIALLRSVGVPARFISGIAYTNSELFPENWGAHGWAEVYFPGFGWVPFDVTYGEFGWIDPTHFKFKDSVDSDEPATYYQWFGRNADLNTNKLDIKTKLIDKTGYFPTPLNIDVSAFREAVSFGSYNLVEAMLENTDDYYYSTELYLIRPKEVKVIGNEFKSILLLPNEKKKIFWILKLDDDLDKQYAYTFPLIVTTTNNITSGTSFKSSIREKDVSFEEVEQVAKLLEEEKEKKYSGNILLDCKISNEEFYEYEDAEVFCTAKNTGNIFIENADVCFENQCTKIDLGISQTKNVTFEVNKSSIGSLEIPVTVRNSLVSKSQFVSYTIKDTPKIEIGELEFPSEVSYDDKFSAAFTVSKNVKIVFTLNSLEKEWFVEELTEDRKFVINIEGNQLKYGTNDYLINVDFSDGVNKQYITKKEFIISLTDATILQRMLLWLNGFDALTPESIAIILLTGTIIFIVIVIVLFRRGRR
jgi:transglutaminase-like putative cysteine protease